jgi:aldose 1-epimerase
MKRKTMIMHRTSTMAAALSFVMLAIACSARTATHPEPGAPDHTPTEAAGSGSYAAEDSARAPASGVRAITEEAYGEVDGKAVKLYTLTNKNGVFAKITNYGAIISELHVPDRNGKLADVVLGFENLDGYREKSPYFGAIVGRVANRIKNARFTLGGKAYKLAANNAPHHLHGGTKGWDKVVWDAEPIDSASGPALRLSYVSNDADEGYPGTVKARATYTLTNDNELRVQMEATSDATTLVNMAHHSYWNLGGHGSGTILDHELTLNASAYTPGNPVPDGAVKPVAKTPFDFTSAKPIGRDLKETGGKPVGYDHNYVVDGPPSELRRVARLKHPKSGRVMVIEADQPGVQFYTGNFLDGSVKGKGQVAYPQYSGLCLESQKFPNSINVPAWKAQVILEKGQVYKHTMIHRFAVE